MVIDPNLYLSPIRRYLLKWYGIPDARAQSFLGFAAGIGPAEERLGGSEAMLNDGLFQRSPLRRHHRLCSSPELGGQNRITTPHVQRLHA